MTDKAKKVGCGEGYYTCDSGMCIPNDLVCDGIYNCNTEDDEENCGQYSTYLYEQHFEESYFF